ncbi:MAG TPA: chemotaxis protein CheB [Mesorhizobium sp.]|jgi:two-component system CheB/CheR fusion protein|uniref:chemotaxis protein CheB n=1 Tax=Mesorhizobium sp. TaxID=1871066 RepID=UPI002DDD85CC|nr:chemotaxis protein CheB [Mesorhizobium sp.]HEV2506702.1 chemotaxis protein CheB [Mesorhizobium sp.]
MMMWGKRETSERPSLIVGIGASAGGLAAFTTFFQNLKPDSGMAFVLVQHLSPDHDSMLTEILSRSALIPVVDAQDGMLVEPDKVYVIPPDATLTIKDSRLLVIKPAPPRSDRRPIDTFFDSLAKDQGRNAVSIVLSGVGSDGALGLGAVKESGGLTIAQAESDHHAMPGMPQSAASTGLVDYVLQIEEIPAKLIEYRDHLALVANRKDGDGTRSDAVEHLATVLSVLRARTGHDFSRYKTKTVTRRVQRRMQVLQADTVPAYIDRLRQDPVEPELLFRELLIGVTEFFRDPDAFGSLSAAIDAILERDADKQSLRVWVPACSTGEEVYSLAIAIRELLDKRGSSVQVQIFGTDIDDRSIDFARAGRYERIAGVTPARLQRWFYQDEGAYCPNRQVREMCVFSVHNVTKDPPFSKLDLISCRNLLIYMDAELQDRILQMFHYALKPGGLLFLGLSEGVSRHGSLFAAQDKAAHIFRRKDGDVTVSALTMPAPSPGASTNITGEPGRGAGDRIDRAVRLALAKHSPVYFVVDRQNNIVRYSGGEVARYLEPSAGLANLSLLSNLRKSLRLTVRTALHSVVKTGQGQVIDNVSALIEGQQRLLSVIVEPVQEAGSEGFCVVAFQEIRAAMPQPSQAGDESRQSPATLAAEQELRTVRAQLHAMISDLETTNEEMKSAAEEYQSVNEELQSTNEELQTSKEEMQSINEELQTVNAEMTAKNELLSNLNSDLQNLLESTQIATIFLDEDLRIKSFTPGMTEIFSLRNSDRGRPLTDIVSMLAYEDLQRDVAKVLRDLTVVERELDLYDRGASYTMRVRPYRSVERVIDGVVITFVDVTERKKAERAKDEIERRFTAIVNQAAVGVAETDRTGRFLLTNAAFQKISGRSAEGLRQVRRFDLIDTDNADDINARYEQAARDSQPIELEYSLRRADGTTVWVHDSVSVLSDKEGHAGSIISVTLEIDERKRAEERAALLLGELDHRVKNILAIVSSIVAQTLKSNLSPEAFTETIAGRITAITRAHSLLTRRGAASVGTLRDLIDTELNPYQDRDIQIAGPAIELTPKAGLSIAMAIHELASNAAKYGSLSAPRGRLSISWAVAQDPVRRLRFAWIESGGPTIPGPPSKRGFGTTLIERSLGFEFEAVVERSFAASGVVCNIDMPFTSEIGELRSAERGGN